MIGRGWDSVSLSLPVRWLTCLRVEPGSTHTKPTKTKRIAPSRSQTCQTNTHTPRESAQPRTHRELRHGHRRMFEWRRGEASSGHPRPRSPRVEIARRKYNAGARFLCAQARLRDTQRACRGGSRDAWVAGRLWLGSCAWCGQAASCDTCGSLRSTAIVPCLMGVHRRTVNVRLLDARVRLTNERRGELARAALSHIPGRALLAMTRPAAWRVAAQRCNVLMWRGA